MNKLFIALIASSMLFASCSGEEKKDDKKEKKEKKEPKTEACTYRVDENKITVGFTAYKFAQPNKKGVNGRFEVIVVQNNLPSEDPMMAASGISFEIPVAELYTGDGSRDKKIKESFFGTMANTDVISGVVKSVEGDQVTIELKMNDISYDIKATQDIKGDKITLNSEILTDNWNGQDAIAALNKVCEANHKTDGGESVLWPDVTLKIEGTLIKECN